MFRMLSEEEVWPAIRSINTSAVEYLIRGLPQGSILGPIH